jgi:hypothetical protein
VLQDLTGTVNKILERPLGVGTHSAVYLGNWKVEGDFSKLKHVSV